MSGRMEPVNPWMTIKRLGIGEVVVVFYAATFGTGPRYRRYLVKVRKSLYGLSIRGTVRLFLEPSQKFSLCVVGFA